jgi:hypothetical protein
MTELAVIEAGCDDKAYDDIAGKIISGIREYGGNQDAVRVVKASSLEMLRGRRPDIVVLSEAPAKEYGGESAHIRCGILLLPGDGDAEAFDAECIVTYGMSPKNTITLSSISETSCVLAIQRELLTSFGDMLDRQEIKIRGGMRPGCLLPVAGALLILGVKLTANP